MGFNSGFKGLNLPDMRHSVGRNVGPALIGQAGKRNSLYLELYNDLRSKW